MSWTTKKAECPRTEAFELWCWRRLLRVLWTARKSKQSILKQISPKYWLERVMLKLKLQYFGHLNVKNWLIRKDPDAGKDWRQEEKGTTEDEVVGWHHRLNGHEFEHSPGVDDGQGSLECWSPWGHKELDTTKWLNWMGNKENFLLFSQEVRFSSPFWLWLRGQNPCKAHRINIYERDAWREDAPIILLYVPLFLIFKKNLRHSAQKKHIFNPGGLSRTFQLLNYILHKSILPSVPELMVVFISYP